MSPDNSINSYSGQSLDDSYWQALFDQEEALANSVIMAEPDDLPWTELDGNGANRESEIAGKRSKKNPWKLAQMEVFFSST